MSFSNDRQQSDPSRKPLIRLTNVSKVYPKSRSSDEVVALNDLSLDVGQGEIFGIIGKSGAGKSTLIRLINQLERPTSGQVLIDDQDVNLLSGDRLRKLRRNIGMIFQHFNLLSSQTVFDNVALPLRIAGVARSEIKHIVEPLLDLVGLSDKRDRYPAELSGGQKQRVGIARALATKPKILLCDEATSALDPETTTAILQLLADINRKLGITIVLITHEIKVIKDICHKVAVLEQGRVVEQGETLGVFAQPHHALTRSLIANELNNELPEWIRTSIASEPGAGGQAIVRVVFTGSSATEPVISRLARRLNIDVNIIFGRVDRLRGSAFGVLLIGIPGDQDIARKAVDFIASHHLFVEVLGYVPSHLRATG